MSSNLPAAVRQAGSLLQNPLALQDAQYQQMIIAWGRQQIEQQYPDDPLRAPMNLVKRKLALMEWDRVVRTQGRELRQVVAGTAVQELRFQLARRQQQILAADAEARRTAAVTFDAQLRVTETTILADREHQRVQAVIQLQHQLAEAAADAASQRRVNERIAETDQQIRTLLIDALLKAAGDTSADETIRATQLVNREIVRIRHDPTLSPDEQHLQIKALLDTLPGMFRTIRARDV